MPAVARKGDSFATGHGCNGSSTIVEGSGDVFTNNIATSRRGDMSAVHSIDAGSDEDPCIPHAVPIAGGSSSVFVNGIAIARVGDSIDAGAITSGSPNVFAGG